MGRLDNLTFVKKMPVVASASRGASPLEKARTKLLTEIEHQISLARDPNFEIITERNKPGGTPETIRRKPKSWVVVQGEDAFITIRFSNKPMPLGGKRGNVIKCDAVNVVGALQTIRDAIFDGEVDDLIGKMIAQSKRKSRSKSKPSATPPPVTTSQ